MSGKRVCNLEATQDQELVAFNGRFCTSVASITESEATLLDARVPDIPQEFQETIVSRNGLFDLFLVQPPDSPPRLLLHFSAMDVYERTGG